jgi:hypothetical protein
MKENEITYVIFDSSTNFFKIGKTTNLKKRLATMRTSNLNLHVVLTLYFVSEKCLHTLYKDRRIKREWFSLKFEDLKDIQELEENEKIREKECDYNITEYEDTF